MQTHVPVPLAMLVSILLEDDALDSSLERLLADIYEDCLSAYFAESLSECESSSAYGVVRRQTGAVRGG